VQVGTDCGSGNSKRLLHRALHVSGGRLVGSDSISPLPSWGIFSESKKLQTICPWAPMIHACRISAARSELAGLPRASLIQAFRSSRGLRSTKTGRSLRRVARSPAIALQAAGHSPATMQELLWPPGRKPGEQFVGCHEPPTLSEMNSAPSSSVHLNLLHSEAFEQATALKYSFGCEVLQRLLRKGVAPRVADAENRLRMKFAPTLLVAALLRADVHARLRRSLFHRLRLRWRKQLRCRQPWRWTRSIPGTVDLWRTSRAGIEIVVSGWPGGQHVGEGAFGVRGGRGFWRTDGGRLIVFFQRWLDRCHRGAGNKFPPPRIRARRGSDGKMEERSARPGSWTTKQLAGIWQLNKEPDGSIFMSPCSPRAARSARSPEERRASGR